jgi:hypothetical protein
MRRIASTALASDCADAQVPGERIATSQIAIAYREGHRTAMREV